MIITYERPTDLHEDDTDPDAPAADMAPGADVDPRVPVCGATTYDVAGTHWTCTRPPQHDDDEHRAVFDRYHGGPVGQLAIAWAYDWGGAGHGPSSTMPMTTVTVTVRFPSTAWTNEQLPEHIADGVRMAFWECDHDDVEVTTTATSAPAPRPGDAGGRWVGCGRPPAARGGGPPPHPRRTCGADGTGDGAQALPGLRPALICREAFGSIRTSRLRATGFRGISSLAPLRSTQSGIPRPVALHLPVLAATSRLHDKKREGEKEQ